MKKKLSITQINIISSVLLQLTVIISGFVIPKIILSLFGSEANGLISSVNQFLNYIELVEGGLGGVVLASLYKPLSRNDTDSVSVIFSSSVRFFRRIGIIYVIYLIVLAFVYPLFVDTGFSYRYSILLILVLGMNLVVQYFISISYRLLLNADRKVYIVSFTQSLLNILNVTAVLICSAFCKDLLIIKLVGALVFMIQPFVFAAYVKRNYNITGNAEADRNVLKQRWAAFATNFAFFVHTNTDIVILTFFAGLANVSVYYIHYMVVTALKGLVKAVSSAFVPSFGKALAEGNRTALLQSFEKYEFIVQIFSYILFSCGIVLITPFVMIYTKGVNDADYYQPLFAVLIMIAEFFFCIRDPYVQSTAAAAMFKKIAPHAYIEAAINIVISVALVGKFGIVGVAVGTITAMLYRMIAQMYLVGRNILHRSMVKSVIKSVVLLASLLGTYFLFRFFGPGNITNIWQWISYALVTFIIQFFVAALLSIILYRSVLTGYFKKDSDKKIS